MISNYRHLKRIFLNARSLVGVQWLKVWSLKDLVAISEKEAKCIGNLPVPRNTWNKFILI